MTIKNNINQKNIFLVAAGIILLSMQLFISVGGVYIDIFNDILAFVLIAIGGFSMRSQNKFFKKASFMIILGLILTGLGQLISFNSRSLEAGNTVSIMCGLSIIVTIYYTYYFNEGIILEAKERNKEALTRSFRLIWTVYGILVFLSFIAQMSGIQTIKIIANLITLMYSIYYCSNIIGISKPLTA